MRQHQSHLEYDTLKSLIVKIGELFHIKAIIAFFGLMMSYIFNGNTEILITIYILIGIDTLTGIAYACKKKRLHSRGFYRVTVKCLVYFLMIVVGRLVDKHAPIHFAAPIMDSFLCCTEAFSVLENIGRLGFPVPTKLMKLLKVYYDKE